MAGIGFRLRRLAESESLAGVLQGYVSAGLVSCGPWILTVLTLCCADLMMTGSGYSRTPSLFRLLIVYAYALTLISTGAPVLVVTRYLADRLYADDPRRHLPTFVAVSLVNTPVQALLALLFVMGLPISLAFKAAFLGLYVVVANLWMITAFLGAVRAYWSVVQAYSVGGLVSVLAMHWFGGPDEVGFLVGFLLGQATAFLLMLRVLMREFELTMVPDFGFLSYFRTYPDLAACGFLLNLGVWIGLFVYWFSPLASWHYGLPTYYPDHDLAVFLGLLSILPAMILFFVKTETEFYEGYRAFFGGITTSKVTLSELQRRKAEMIDSLVQGLGDLLKVQGLVTLVMVLYPGVVLAPLQLSPVTLQITRNCALGAFMLVIFQGTATILLYYEAYREVALSALTLVLVNSLAAYISLGYPSSTHGLGLALGSTAALAVALAYLVKILRQLEQITFMRQPMPGQQRFPRGESFAEYVIRDGQRVHSQ